MKRRSFASPPALSLLGPAGSAGSAAEQRVAPALVESPDVVESPAVVAGNLPVFFEALRRRWPGAALSVCWMTTLRELMVPGDNTLRGQSAFYMLHPGLYRYLDIPDVASIAAPRPMLFFGAEHDPLFSAAGMTAAYAKLRAVWRSRAADDRLTTRMWPGPGHVFVEHMQEEAFAWLERWLPRRPGRTHG